MRSAVEPDVEAAIDELYRGDPGQFVEGRNALAKEVRSRDREVAKEIRRLRRPTKAAWALNRTAASQEEDIRELLRAGRSVTEAQRAALEGDDPDVLRDALDRRQEVTRRLADAAVEVSGEGQRNEIEATLDAASVDEEVGDRLRRGRLERPHEQPSGVAGLTTMAATGDPGPRRPRRDTKRRKRIERRLRRAERSLERSEEQLERASRRLANAQHAVSAAEQAVDRDRRARDELLEDLQGVS